MARAGHRPVDRLRPADVALLEPRAPSGVNAIVLHFRTERLASVTCTVGLQAPGEGEN